MGKEDFADYCLIISILCALIAQLFWLIVNAILLIALHLFFICVTAAWYMEPEKDFLENAATMVTFAQKEIKQFLTWTAKSAEYRANAEELSTDLALILVRIKKLQQQYGS